MNTTMQILMSVFTIAGFVIAKVHTILSSPVGRDVMKVLAEAANQQEKAQAHGKLRAIASHGKALFSDLAIIKHAADNGAQQAGAGSVDAEMEAVIAQAKALYLSQKNRK